MIFFRTDEKEVVSHWHFQPFDEKNGLNKTQEELEQEGYLIEDNEYPDIPQEDGKRTITHYNETDGFYFTYVDKEPTSEERIAELEEVVTLLKGGA